ncbi:putative regulatory protein [Deltalipothrixvirus pozzuoliense]|uniref:Putative zinc finger protein ORF104b n=1 Tax=Acidianus filamentous virus 2 (isolate Italy/Pozzuoli) TaxID=654910 RepID=Y104B_AFV2P|nr:putative regulatory protein [Acidianus filamentous virus 2]Q573G1.1 RecName: Full=Putative zinc finger protein ORF104b [Acidianus filamentous virus 2 (isolate Pozzuoli)]CAH69395.1 putative regulatory protein [Acidianus filamentous virus 2]
MKRISFKVEDELARNLDKYSMQNHLTRSEAIRQILREKLSIMQIPTDKGKVVSGIIINDEIYECKYCHTRYLSHTGIVYHLEREHNIKKPFSPHIIKIVGDKNE